jgi:hypothetical protein
MKHCKAMLEENNRYTPAEVGRAEGRRVQARNRRDTFDMVRCPACNGPLVRLMTRGGPAVVCPCRPGDN